jgi:peptidoglycan/LPS O-acetylase OafA/YrhL
MTFFLDVQWLVLLGDASYSLYLIHSLLISRTLDLLATLPHTARVAAANRHLALVLPPDK